MPSRSGCGMSFRLWNKIKPLRQTTNEYMILRGRGGVGGGGGRGLGGGWWWGVGGC